MAQQGDQRSASEANNPAAGGASIKPSTADSFQQFKKQAKENAKKVYKTILLFHVEYLFLSVFYI